MRWIWPARVPDTRDFPHPVHDGDTLWLEVDDGRRRKSLLDIRLRGVYAPELKDPGGLEVHRFVVAWLESHAFTKWPFALETFQTRTGNDVKTLGRYLGVLYAGDPDSVRAMSLPVANFNNHIARYVLEHGWGPGVTTPEEQGVPDG
jgi:endonuclease YncB( thermonuclease family)